MQQWNKYTIIDANLRKRILNPNDPLCPFYGYRGNDAAVRHAVMLAEEAFNSLYYEDDRKGIYCARLPLDANFKARPHRIRVTGPKSVGKTTFAKLYHKLIGTDYITNKVLMPWVELDGTNVSTREQIFDEIVTAMTHVGLELVVENIVNGVYYYKLPTMVLFIDEVHALKKKIRESFLKMTEANDGIFKLENKVVDCSNITVIIATTDVGKLEAPFKSRFPHAINLNPHSLEDAALIIKDATGWDIATCMRLVRYKPVLREAKEIAALVSSRAKSNHVSPDVALTEVAKNLNMNDGDMNQRAIDVLLALYDSPLSKKNICTVMDMDELEFENDILPKLLKNAFHPSYIEISGKHRITEAGINELRRRNLVPMLRVVS